MLLVSFVSHLNNHEILARSITNCHGTVIICSRNRFSKYWLMEKIVHHCSLIVNCSIFFSKLINILSLLIASYTHFNGHTNSYMWTEQKGPSHKKCPDSVKHLIKGTVIWTKKGRNRNSEDLWPLKTSAWPWNSGSALWSILYEAISLQNNFLFSASDGLIKICTVGRVLSLWWWRAVSQLGSLYNLITAHIKPYRKSKNTLKNSNVSIHSTLDP